MPGSKTNTHDLLVKAPKTIEELSFDLFDAVMAGNYSAVERLLNKGAKPDFVLSFIMDGQEVHLTPMHAVGMAFSFGIAEGVLNQMVQLFHGVNGVNMNVAIPGLYSQNPQYPVTPAEFAAMHGSETLSMSIDNPPVFMDLVNGFDSDPSASGYSTEQTISPEIDLSSFIPESVIAYAAAAASQADAANQAGERDEIAIARASTAIAAAAAADAAAAAADAAAYAEAQEDVAIAAAAAYDEEQEDVAAIAAGDAAATHFTYPPIDQVYVGALEGELEAALLSGL